MSLSRRALFRGRSVKLTNAMRLPWSGDRQTFLDKCTTCGDCISQCPENIIVRGEGQYPVIDFSRGECTFCQSCVDACAPGALSLDAASATGKAFAYPATILDSCFANQNIFCRSCSEVCPEEAIHFPRHSAAMHTPDVDTESCNGCGACIGPCPANAITIAETASFDTSRADANRAEKYESSRIQ